MTRYPIAFIVACGLIGALLGTAIMQTVRYSYPCTKIVNVAFLGTGPYRTSGTRKGPTPESKRDQPRERG